MKRLTVMTAALLCFSAPLAAFAADHAMHEPMIGGPAHEEVVNGVKATFKIISIKEHMKGMKMQMPNEMKETHHLMVECRDVKTGKPLIEGEVKVKVQGPDKSMQIKELTGMQGHFGADFVLSQKGRYGVMAKSQLKDGKIRTSKFWYTVK